MSDTTTRTADWAWAVVDQVFTPDRTGFTEHHTVGLAHHPDPAPGDYLHEPERTVHVPMTVGAGLIAYREPVHDWGWAVLGAIEEVDSTVRAPVDLPGFGTLTPGRGAVRVRRIGIGAPDAHEAVPYADELEALFAPEHTPTALGGDSDHVPLGSVRAALALTASVATAGAKHCEESWSTEPAPDEAECRHMNWASTTIASFHSWFPEVVREHGLPTAGVDSHQVCTIVAEQVAAHPDAAFKTEAQQLALGLNATNDIDPEHLAIITATSD